jgi:hypothetical protein
MTGTAENESVSFFSAPVAAAWSITIKAVAKS